MIPRGRPFFKMSGSGNDFVMVDARETAPGALMEAAAIRRICERATGVGADGIVFLEPSPNAAIKLVYLNADGSRADFCGNATLCTTRLSVELGIAAAGKDFLIETDSGPVTARVRKDGSAEIDLPPVSDVKLDAAPISRAQGEERLGYAVAGVPHLVVVCADTEQVDVVGRGRPLRMHGSLPAGANVNFVSRPSASPSPNRGAGGRASRGGEGNEDGIWRTRTYERGVEGETLACGSGAVASAVLLTAWGLAEPPVRLATRSGKVLEVRLARSGDSWLPSLSGEARLVFRGELAEF